MKARFSLDPTSINSKSLEVFKSKLLALIRPVQRSVYSVFNPQGLKYLTQLRLGLSNLNTGLDVTLKTALTHCPFAVWK